MGSPRHGVHQYGDSLLGHEPADEAHKPCLRGQAKAVAESTGVNRNEALRLHRRQHAHDRPFDVADHARRPRVLL